MTMISLEIPELLASQLAETAKIHGLSLDEFFLLAAAEKWANLSGKSDPHQASCLGGQPGVVERGPK